MEHKTDLLNKTRQIPPRFAKRILLRFLREDLVEEVCGDLEEKFYVTLAKTSLFSARRNYWYQVLNYVRPFAVRKSKSVHLTEFGMYQNYFKISVRSLLKQKLYSGINIGGLTIGLTCFIIIMLYVQHELSFDRFYKDSDRIYRVYQRQVGNTHLGTDYFAVTPALLPSVLQEEFPEVEHATSVADEVALLGVDDHHFYEKGLAADHHFFDVFGLPFLRGNSKLALNDPKSIILTTSLARKIFGTEDPIGQTINYQNEDAFVVTGVINDPPSNSSLQFSFVINLLSNSWYNEEMKQATWDNNAFHSFFLLAEGADPQLLQKKFPALITKYRDPVSYASYPFKDEYLLQKLPDIHLETGINDDIGLKGNQRYVILFSVVALIVLLLACVNYMNLAIARSIKRAREVGLRKVVGAVRRQLIVQFLGESVLIALLSLLLALGLTYVLVPFFGRLMERQIELDLFANKLLIPGLLMLVIVVGLFSGSYPAVIMSSLRPVEVLKGKIKGGLAGSGLQRWLLIGQYAVAITLVISSFVIYTQLRFMQEKELGYDRKNVITIPVRDYSLIKGFETLRGEWQNNSNILAATFSTSLPTHITSSHIINDEVGNSKGDDVAIYESRVSHDFIDVFGITLLEGRNFSREIESDVNAYLINETAAKALGWSPKDAIGKEIIDDGTKTIIGVIKDFHMHSMHLPIQPLLLRINTTYVNYISVKIKGKNIPETISFLEETIKKRSAFPFEYQFLDERFDQLYKSEMKLGEIFGVFTILSILIASLGLFGLAAFMSEQRTKEIGIRKVLGASIQSIMLLLTKDFLGMVAFAFLVSIPVAWFVMHRWLEEFAYRISMEWWMFFAAGGLALMIAYITISYQSLRASLMDPVESLKSE